MMITLPISQSGGPCRGKREFARPRESLRIPGIPKLLWPCALRGLVQVAEQSSYQVTWVLRPKEAVPSRPWIVKWPNSLWSKPRAGVLVLRRTS